jgi:hypothetical protein
VIATKMIGRSVLGATLAANKPGLLEPVDQTGDSGDHGDCPLRDLEDRQRPALTPQDEEHVVQRRGESVFAEQPREADLHLVAGPQQAEYRLRLRRDERLSLADLVLELAGPKSFSPDWTAQFIAT